MPKNKIGGKKHKGKKNDIKVAKTLEVPEENESIGQVSRANGNGRFSVRCIDGVTRLGILRGTMRKRVWIHRLDLLLVEPWDFETDKCSILHKYDDDEYEKLKILGHIPKEFKLEGDECNDDDDDYFSYNISDSDTEEDDNPIVSDEKIVKKESSSSDDDIDLDDI
jgi:translation initiation factor 1A